MNVAVGIVWQTALVALGIYIVIQNFEAFLFCLAIIAISMSFLKYNWYDKMKDYPDDIAGEMKIELDDAASKQRASDELEHV